MSSSETIGSSSQATVPTERSERYGKQLVSHLGRRNGGDWSTTERAGWIDLGIGRATLTATDDALHLNVVATAEDLPRLQDVLAGHLARFGERDELHVTWTSTTPVPLGWATTDDENGSNQ